MAAGASLPAPVSVTRAPARSGEVSPDPLLLHHKLFFFLFANEQRCRCAKAGNTFFVVLLIFLWCFCGRFFASLFRGLGLHPSPPLATAAPLAGLLHLHYFPMLEAERASGQTWEELFAERYAVQTCRYTGETFRRLANSAHAARVNCANGVCLCRSVLVPFVCRH